MRLFHLIFEEIAVTTDSGTVLELATLEKIRSELDAYLYYQRTGVDVMADLKRFPWNKVFQNAGTSIDAPDHHKKVMSYIEGQLKEWVSSRPVGGTTGVVLDPSFEKTAKVVLHKLLKNSGNKMKIDSLAALYAMATEQGTDEDSIAAIRDQIRAFISRHHEAFDISRGGLATVIRLQDERGKATGETPFALTSGGGSSTKEIQRYTKSVVALGFTNKRQFAQAKADGAVTLQQLKDWLNKHKS